MDATQIASQGRQQRRSDRVGIRLADCEASWEHPLRARFGRTYVKGSKMSATPPIKARDDVDVRLHGLEFAMDESVPELVGALVLHLARKGVIDLVEFEADLREQFIPDSRMEDSTGALYAALAGLVAQYRRNASDPS